MVHVGKENTGEYFFLEKKQKTKNKKKNVILPSFYCVLMFYLWTVQPLLFATTCYWRSAFKNDLAFDYHVIIRMVIILKWNPSQPKAIENCQVCSSNYTFCLLLFAYFLELHLLKLLNWTPFLYHFGLSDCINSSWVHFELTGFFTQHKLAMFALERYGILPSCFQNKSNLHWMLFKLH